ncbi:MAG: hypothetical protein ACLSB9_25125 [Hydrogeniiclostridium mannosilyticum]
MYFQSRNFAQVITWLKYTASAEATAHGTPNIGCRTCRQMVVSSGVVGNINHGNAIDKDSNS